ncbi:MAG: sugar-binding transcriptional regulator [Rhodoglobus sp.]
MNDDQRHLIATLARQYYFEDRSKSELANAFGISRFKIARLLEQGREEGIVTIEINDGDEYRPTLSAELAHHLKLVECVVVRAGDTEEENRRLLARAAAAHITGQVHEGDVLGFSWGRTLVSIGAQLEELPPSTILQLTGTVGNDFAQSPVEVIRRIAGRSNVETMAIFSPLFATSEDAARSLRSDPAIQQAMALYEKLALAVLSIGSWDPPISQLFDMLSPADHDELAREGAKAEMAGIFLRQDGSLIEATVAKRRISVSVPELLATPRVLAVAGSAEKVGAIAAVARSGLVTSLITDDKTAAMLKKLPAVENHVLARQTRSSRR